MGEGAGGGEEKEFGPPSPLSPPTRGGEVLGGYLPDVRRKLPDLNMLASNRSDNLVNAK